MLAHRPFGPAARLATVLASASLLTSAAAAQHATVGHDAAAKPGASHAAPRISQSQAAAAAVRWNELARTLVGGHGGTGMATRPLAVLGAAQLEANRAPAGLREAALSAASAEVLGALFPEGGAQFRVAREADVARRRLGAVDRAIADSLGLAAARVALAHARADRSDIAWRGTVPATAGSWTSAAGVAPVGATWATIRPWILTSPDQFRPAPPPAVGTAAFAAQLDTVRRALAARTPAQLASARHWAEVPLARYWNEEATRLLTKHGITADAAPEVLAALNLALADANVACFDAKYAFWSIRPSQADTSIRLDISLPNFPAYPSGHACLSAAAATVLGHYAPAERAALERTVTEVSDSRLYGGVHYPLDNAVGIDIGRKVATAVLGAVRAGWPPSSIERPRDDRPAF